MDASILLIMLLIVLAYLLGPYSPFDNAPLRHRKSGSRENQSAQQSVKIRDDGLRKLIREGRIDEATDLYRQFAGVDLYSAQQAIKRYMREIRLSLEVDESASVDTMLATEETQYNAAED